METELEEICYRVNFNQTINFDENNANLSFFGRSNPFKYYKNNLYLELSNIINKKDHKYNINLIKTVLPSENYTKKLDYNYYYIVLINEPNELNVRLKKKGFLIGRTKDNQEYILGVWSYLYFSSIKTNFNLAEEKLINILKNPDNFDQIILINQI